MNDFIELQKNVISLLFLDCNIKTIYGLVQINSKIKTILNSNIFWMKRVYRDYGIFGHDPTVVNQLAKQNNDKINWKIYYSILFINKYKLSLNLPIVFYIYLHDTRINISDKDNFFLKSICDMILTHFKPNNNPCKKIKYIKYVKMLLRNKKISSLFINQDIKEYNQVAQVILYDHMYNNTIKNIK